MSLSAVTSSAETFKEAMRHARNLVNPEDRIAIYIQIIALAPCRFEEQEQLIIEIRKQVVVNAHKKFIALTKDQQKKKEPLLQVADLARKAAELTLEVAFGKDVETPRVLTKAGWVNPQFLNLPPYPKELQDWLNENCPFKIGKKRYETHIVFPIFPKVSLGDDFPPVPFNIETLDRLDKSTQGIGFRVLQDQIPKGMGAMGATEEFCWGAIYRDVIPGSKNQTFAAQEQCLPQGYEIPGVFEMALGLLWDYRRFGTRCFGENPWIYARCKEIIDGYRFIVGGFSSAGLYVGGSYSIGNYEFLGVGAIRKFRFLDSN